MTMTYAEALARVGVTVPEHLLADAEVPVLTGLQAQGDLLIIPIDHLTVHALAAVPDAGIQVVFGEATGNSHWLHRGFDSPGVSFARVDDELRLMEIEVPEGQNAQLVHTDEHGSAGIGPGLYAIHAKRELRDEVTRVQD